MLGSFGGGGAGVTADASGQQPASSAPISSTATAAGTDSTAALACAGAKESGRIVSMAPSRRPTSAALLVQRVDQWSVPSRRMKALSLAASDLPSFLAAGERCLDNEVSKRRANDGSATRQIST
jgi:hypothetical protein